MNKILTGIMKLKFLYAIALASMAVACNSSIIDAPQHYGTISVALGSPNVEVVTKSDPVTLTPESDGASDYTVRIFNDSEEMMHEVTYDRFTEPKVLPFDTYYVTVENCTEAEAEEGYGVMRLYGRTEDDIILDASNLSASAVVNCTVANAKVSVEFDESVKDRFNDLKVALTGGTTRGEALVIAETETGVVTETWFNPSDLTYTIEGTFVGGGMDKPVSVSKTMKLQAKNNIRLVVKVSLQGGLLIVPEITFDTTIDDPTEIPGGFNPYE